MTTSAVRPFLGQAHPGCYAEFRYCHPSRYPANSAKPSKRSTPALDLRTSLAEVRTAPTPFNGSTSNSIWYGGNKTTDEVLKNIFDQFNNQMAFGSF